MYKAVTKTINIGKCPLICNALARTLDQRIDFGCRTADNIYQ